MAGGRRSCGLARISSACSSRSPMPRSFVAWNRRAASAGRSSHLATAFHDWWSTREIDGLLTPSPLDRTTRSSPVSESWIPAQGDSPFELEVLSQRTQRSRGRFRSSGVNQKFAPFVQAPRRPMATLRLSRRVPGSLSSWRLARTDDTGDQVSANIRDRA